MFIIAICMAPKLEIRTARALDNEKVNLEWPKKPEMNLINYQHGKNE